MDQPFIYKYKPKTLEEFEIDENILTLLNTLIEIDMLNILLVGNAGSGKSTIIDCLIKKYYGDSYNSNNILIINSLKDQGISYYRSEVKIFCQTMSNIPGKKKIIVLDDIDNINEQSQQVFRNCMDKYSNNVNFLSSCSNTQKVIDSFQSRVSMVKLKPLPNIYLKNIINKIITEERIDITEQAINFILSIANNSVRTIISYLEKFKLLNKKIDYNIAINTCSNISFNDFESFLKFSKEQDLNNALKIIYEIYDRGYSVIDILDNFFIYIKITSLIDEENKYKIIKLICKYIIIFYNIHEEQLELALLTNNLINILKNF